VETTVIERSASVDALVFPNRSLDEVALVAGEAQPCVRHGFGSYAPAPQSSAQSRIFVNSHPLSNTHKSQPDSDAKSEPLVI
jgi:hypothetical protein